MQFHLIARTNNWDYSARELVLASCLRGKARAILEGGTELEDLCFYELVSRLELRFRESHLTGIFYTQFTNRKQIPGEDLPTLGGGTQAAFLPRLSGMYVKRSG